MIGNREKDWVREEKKKVEPVKGTFSNEKKVDKFSGLLKEKKKKTVQGKFDHGEFITFLYSDGSTERVYKKKAGR